MTSRRSWTLAALSSFTLLLMMVLPSAPLSGDLAPPAEAFDPNGQPVATNPELPSWSRSLPANRRWVPVLGNLGVLDRQTGLVWEYTPQSIQMGDVEYDWGGAKKLCWGNSDVVQGWHLMNIEEFFSLSGDGALDAFDPAIRGRSFWLATTHVYDPNSAYLGTVPSTPFGSWRVDSVDYKLAGQHGFWCVRGSFGGGADSGWGDL